MIRPRLALSFIVLLWLMPTGAAGYVHDYPPFSFGGSVPWPTLEAAIAVGWKGEVEFPEDGVRIDVTRADMASAMRVWVSGEEVFNTATAYPGVRFENIRTYYTDLTGDGHKDILTYTFESHGGVAWILIAEPDGGFWRRTFQTYWAGPEDFVDVNGDGRYEMLWVFHFKAGGHSYWVYRLLEIGEGGLRLRDDLAPGFPKIIWFTHRPNDQPASDLSPAVQEELLQQSTVFWERTYEAP